MKKNSILFLFIAFPLMTFFFVLTLPSFAQTTGGSPSVCISDPVDFGITKKFLPLPNECNYITGQIPNGPNRGTYCGRAGFDTGLYSPAADCVTPTHIVMHTTKGDTTAEGNYQYFSTGGGGHGTGSHFVIGQDGTMLQMVETGKTQVEYAQAVGGIDEHISIEMGSPVGDGTAGPSDLGLYKSKQDMIDRGSQLQYDNALKLVKSLMEQYNIPLENVVSHKSLGGGAGDPGDGWMEDFKKDLPGAAGLDGVSTSNPTGGGSSSGSRTSTSCVQTQIGTPSGPRPSLPAECTRSSGSSGGGGVGTGMSSDDFVNVAEEIKIAYDLCGKPPGSTYPYNDPPYNEIISCMADAFKKQGYTDQQINAFSERLPSSVYGCTQCLGFVGLVAALWSGTSDPEKTLQLSNGRALGTAGNINDYHAGGEPLTVGNSTYKVIGSGPSADIQPGDIGVAGTGQGGDHILIVRDIDPDNPALFGFVDSNGESDCRAETDETRGYRRPKDGYTFYRRQN